MIFLIPFIDKRYFKTNSICYTFDKIFCIKITCLTTKITTMPIIAISVSLLAIVAGMTLFTKTQKEGLGLFFKSVSLFVIIAGFLNIFAVCAFTAMKACYMKGEYHNKMKQHCKGMHDGNMQGYMWGDNKHEGMGMHQHGLDCSMENPMCKAMKMHECEGKMMEGECMHGMHDGACEMKNKPCAKEIEKDSVIVKRMKR